MTIRKSSTGEQEKITVEHSQCVIRRYKTYPKQYVLLSERFVTKNDLRCYVATNLAINMASMSDVNIYFNGDNFRKFIGE
jgi:hypothetical protein